MTDTLRKTPRPNPPSREPSQAQPKSSDAAAGGREPDPTEDNKKVLDRLDEIGKAVAERLGLPVEAVNGSLTREERLAQDREELDREMAEDLGIPWRKRARTRRAEPEAPAKPAPTPEQQRAREAAFITFKYLPRKSTTLH